ncbi:MAG: hypothetical protein WCG27_02450, partial [Pseudomonadota bacterium]
MTRLPWTPRVSLFLLFIFFNLPMRADDSCNELLGLTLSPLWQKNLPILIAEGQPEAFTFSTDGEIFAGDALVYLRQHHPEIMTGPGPWTWLELPPEDFSQIMMPSVNPDKDSNKDYAQRYLQWMAKCLDKAFSQDWPTLTADVDDRSESFLEIRHTLYHLEPADYLQDLLWARANFPSIQRHLHVGVPSAYVSREKLFAIARPIEATIILN